MEEEVIEATEKVIEIATAPSQTEGIVGTVTEEVVHQTKNLFHIDEISQYFTLPNIVHIVFSVITILIMILIYRILKRIINGKAKDKIQPVIYNALSRGITYVFYVILVMYILGLFGVNLTGILGAAGVAGVAIGFAAQTSISNIISGLFVIGEKSLKVGDFINVNDVSGTVQSVGFLSVRVATLDNQIVRIPNATIISENLTNYSAMPIRRFCFEIPLDYGTDLDKAMESIMKVPGLCECILKDPAPVAFYDGFGDGIIMKFAVWFKSSDLIAAKNQVYTNIVKVFREDNIVIPFVHYDVTILNNEKAGKASGKKEVKTVTKKSSVKKSVK